MIESLHIRWLICFAVALCATARLSLGDEIIIARFELNVASLVDSQNSFGTLYYASEKTLRVNVISPLDQWMVFEEDTLLIYYPNEKSGIRIPSIEGNVTLPIFQLVLNSRLEDLGLTPIGYELDGIDISGDTMIARWKPPELPREVIGDIIATYVNDSLLTVDVLNPKDELVSHQVYCDYMKAGRRLFPRFASITKYADGDSVVEAIRFEQVEFPEVLPGEAWELEIPDDAEIRHIEW